MQLSVFILHYHICTSYWKAQLPAAGPRHQVHLDVLLLLGGRHPAQLRHQPRVADPHRAAVAEVLGVVLLRVQRQVARSQHGGAAPGSPQLVAVLTLARVYQRGLGHLALVVCAEGGAGAWYGGQWAHPLLASPRQAGLGLRIDVLAVAVEVVRPPQLAVHGIDGRAGLHAAPRPVRHLGHVAGGRRRGPHHVAARVHLRLLLLTLPSSTPHAETDKCEDDDDDGGNGGPDGHGEHLAVNLTLVAKEVPLALAHARPGRVHAAAALVVAELRGTGLAVAPRPCPRCSCPCCCRTPWDRTRSGAPLDQAGPRTCPR